MDGANRGAVQGLVPDGLGHAGRGPRLYFQRVPEPKSAKNRVHLDVQLDDDLDEQVERLRGTGAGFVRFDSQPGHRWAVMPDPEGNEFCVTPPPPGR